MLVLARLPPLDPNFRLLRWLPIPTILGFGIRIRSVIRHKSYIVLHTCYNVILGNAFFWYIYTPCMRSAPAWPRRRLVCAGCVDNKHSRRSPVPGREMKEKKEGKGGKRREKIAFHDSRDVGTYQDGQGRGSSIRVYVYVRARYLQQVSTRARVCITLHRCTREEFYFVLDNIVYPRNPSVILLATGTFPLPSTPRPLVRGKIRLKIISSYRRTGCTPHQYRIRIIIMMMCSLRSSARTGCSLRFEAIVVCRWPIPR